LQSERRGKQQANMSKKNDSSIKYAGLFRRLLAIIYDLFLLIALLFVATAFAMILNQGKAIEPGQPLYPYYLVYLCTVGFVFFGWFWTHGGQTLGMKTWKIQLEQIDGKSVSWQLALIRFFTAILSWSLLGMGFVWSLFQSQKRTWHDIASNCVMIDLRTKK
jgi:uncharacterized RDD family membrane protein YckC